MLHDSGRRADREMLAIQIRVTPPSERAQELLEP